MQKPVSGKLLKNCGKMDGSELIDELSRVERPYRERMSLIPQRRSLTMTVPSDLWREHRSLDNPGQADCYYLPDNGIMVVDLDGSE